MFNSKVILKYVFIHLAELALVVCALIVISQFISINKWITIIIISIWILKDIIIYFKVWRSYAFYDNNPIRELIGLETTVINGLNPAGYVRVKGELWKAEIRNPMYPSKKGDKTRVVDIRGMTLIVENCNDRQAHPGTES